jgi:hypothetical protein
MLLRRSAGNRQTFWNGGTSTHPVSLGIGKLITWITITVFYVLLYPVWQ